MMPIKLFTILMVCYVLCATGQSTMEQSIRIYSPVGGDEFPMGYMIPVCCVVDENIIPDQYDLYIELKGVNGHPNDGPYSTNLIFQSMFEENEYCISGFASKSLRSSDRYYFNITMYEYDLGLHYAGSIVTPLFTLNNDANTEEHIDAPGPISMFMGPTGEGTPPPDYQQPEQPSSFDSVPQSSTNHDDDAIPVTPSDDDDMSSSASTITAFYKFW